MRKRAAPDWAIAFALPVALMAAAMALSGIVLLLDQVAKGVMRWQ
ncbi:hypothetical protein FHS96_004999 [Sphingomonas zeicaulis]